MLFFFADFHISRFSLFIISALNATPAPAFTSIRHAATPFSLKAFRHFFSATADAFAVAPLLSPTPRCHC
jgi:hypothetical protein